MAFSADTLVPRLKVPAFLKALTARGVPPDQVPITEPFVGDLLVAYAFDTPTQFIMATDALLARAGLSRESLGPLALKNLLRMVRSLNLELQVFPPSLHQFTVPDLAACLMLVHSLWEGTMAQRIGDEIVVAVPHRDILLACKRADADTLALVMQGEERARASGEGDSNSLSTKLYVRTGGRWSLFA